MRQALVRLNPDLPREALEDAYRKLTRVDAPSLIERNRAVHRMLVDGVDGRIPSHGWLDRGAQARVIDFDNPDSNDWLAVNQFTVSEGQHTRRPDVVLFVNGLPLAVIELKNAADENATVWSAFQQLQTYQAQIPALFATNAVLVASDGVQARIGSLGAGKEWFKPWRTITGREDAPAKHARAASGARRRVREAPLPRSAPLLHRVRGSATGWRGKLVKKMAGLPPVPRGERGGRGNAARGRRRMAPIACRRRQGGTSAGNDRRRAWRPPRRRGLAHAGLGQEPDHGVLRRPGDPAPGDGESRPSSC